MTKTRSAVAFMSAGLGLTVAAALVAFASPGVLEDHIRAGYPSYGQDRIDEAGTAWLIVLSVIAGAGAGGWLAAIWAVRAGKPWAPLAVTALFVLGTTVALTAALIRDTSGDTGLPPLLGWAGVAPCLAGLLAVVALWRQRGWALSQAT